MSPQRTANWSLNLGLGLLALMLLLMVAPLRAQAQAEHRLDNPLDHLRYEAETLLPETFSLDGLFYQPRPPPNLSWLQRALAIILALLLITGLIMAYVIAVNRRYCRALAESIRANQALAGQSRFQALVTELSTDFISADLSTIDAKINRFLACVGRFFEVDRSYLFRFSGDLARMDNTHEWCASGITSFLHKNTVETDALPWWKRQVLTADYVLIQDVEHLPPDAAAEQEEFRRQGIQSLLTVPIRVGDTRIGFFGFDSVRRRRHWTPAQISLMTILANQLAEAELKMRKERELLAAKQRAESATEAKTRFLANMSHEIRTPMNAVIGMAQLALHASPRPEVRERLLHIEQAGRALLQIINDILDLSKIESGRLELETRPFRLVDVLAYLRSVLAIAAADRGNRVRIEVDPAIPDYLIGDGLRLGQALLNLAGNAVKFTEHGVIQVRVRLLDCRADSVRLGFWVHDSGIGIDVEKLPMLYDPFWQADSSTTRRYGGSGLGLPITKQLLALMGGEIQVRSRSRRGTTFLFELDFPTVDREALAQLAEDEVRHRRPLAERDRALFQDRRLLLVEDNDLNRELTIALLGELGIRPAVAANGSEAVQKALADDFDLILMDIQMPEMDGLAATRAIRRHEVERAARAQRPAPVPIIALTAHATDSDRAHSLTAGMDDHLPKPIDSHQLWQVLQRWLLRETTAALTLTEAHVSANPSTGEHHTAATRTEPLHRTECQASHQTSGLGAQSLPAQLPPFDLAAALRRCDGNRNLLRRLILGFARDHADVQERLRALIDRNQPQQAEQLAHTLKSTASALELRALSEVASQLEVALRQSASSSRIDALLANLGDRLAPAVQAARQLHSKAIADSDVSTQQSPATTDVSPKPQEQGLIQFKTLREQVQNNRFSARDTLAELRSQLGDDLGQLGQASRVAELARALEQLDYAGAAALIDALIANRSMA